MAEEAVGRHMSANPERCLISRPITGILAWNDSVTGVIALARELDGEATDLR